MRQEYVATKLVQLGYDHPDAYASLSLDRCQQIRIESTLKIISSFASRPPSLLACSHNSVISEPLPAEPIHIIRISRPLSALKTSKSRDNGHVIILRSEDAESLRPFDDSQVKVETHV